MKIVDITRRLAVVTLGGSLLWLGSAGIAVAQEGTQDMNNTPGQRAEKRIDRREARQQRRIHQGMQSGQLTPHEAHRMERQQAGVARQEKRIEADGKVTRHEAARMEHHQDRTSRHIRRQKHDAQTTGQ